MSNSEILEALEQRDEAIKVRLDELAQKQDRLATVDERLVALEQRGHGETGPVPGMNTKQHDFGRVLKAVSDPRREIDGFEAEWSQEFVNKTGLDFPGAVWVPMSTKAVDMGSESPSSGGGNLVPTDLRNMDFIDILRQQSVIMRLNPRMIDAAGNVAIPKASSGSTAYWIDGDGTAITESEPVYTQVTLQPKFCAGWVKYNYRVGLQTGGDVENIIRADLAAQIAAEIDNQAINGDGTSNKPTGILNTSGINAHTYTSSPKAVYWTDVVELERLLIEDKVPLTPGRCHYIAGTTAYYRSKTTQRNGANDATMLADWLGQSAPSLNGYPLHVSTHMPAAQLLFGNFDELLVATWGAVALMSDPYTDFSKGTTGVRAIAPIDIAVRHAVSFAVAS